jgi:hypothetical protein
MNGNGTKKRTKRVSVTFEWTVQTDLRLILDELKDLIGAGIEMYHNQKKSVQIEDKWHEVEFRQEYVDVIHDSVEREINGELKLVIKSKI